MSAAEPRKERDIHEKSAALKLNVFKIDWIR